MESGTPSRTAIVAAAFRALHQTRDDGRVFRDPFAEDILGPEATPVLMALPASPGYRSLRFLMAARSRFAGDALDRAVAEGCRQLVVLGAGLDTFSLRNPYRSLGLRVFEVDHPSTQADKRRRLLRFGPHLPDGLTLVPVVFGEDDLVERLVAAGWHPDQPTVFQWLGVVVYLTRDIVLNMLAVMAAVPEATVIFDYMIPPEDQPPKGREVTEALMKNAAEQSEPWLGFFAPETLAEDLKELGFVEIEDLDLHALRERYLGETRPAEAGDPGPHVLSARTAR